MHTRASVSKTGARVFVGLVFAMTAAAKAADYYGFIEKAAYYRGFSYDVLTFGAWATILVEVLLAALFLGGLGLRRVAGPLAMFVLLLFSGLIAYAWKRYGIDDCACLGSLAETPPWAALVKNAVLFGLILYLSLDRDTPPRPTGRRICLTTALILVGSITSSLAILHQTQV